MLIRILELISVPKHSRDSFILIIFNTLSSWREIVSVLSSQWCNSINWIYLNEADVFLQFPILIRILELISVPNYSRDSFILIKFNTLSLWSEIKSVLSSKLCNSLNWMYLDHADCFPQFPMLIRILELISVPKHSRESFNLIQFNTLSLWSEIVSVHSSQWCNSLNWIYLNDEDVFLQFPILIRILELISVLNHSRDSFILIIFNTLSSWREIVSVLSSQWCSSLNWIYLNDADVFPQFPMLIRILELISVPKHSRESFILIQFNTLSLWSEIVGVHSSQWCNSLNWIYLNDEDVFLQFPILIRILELISVLNHSRDSFILIIFNTLSSWREIVSVLSSQWCSSLNWIYLNDEDVFLQFPILIRILELISVLNHSRDSFILIIFNTLSSWREIVSVLSSQWCSSLNWIYLNDADVFPQFPMLIRILELISVPKHSRESFILIQFNTLSLWSEIVGVHSSQWCNSLNWIYLNDEDVFLQFPILIRILELISVLNHSRDSFILIIFNTLSSWREIVSVLSSQWCSSLNWIYLNDEDVFLQFPILIRILELISVLNHSRDSFILIIFNTLSSWREIVSVLSSQWCSSLNWIYLNDADVFPQFPMLIRILELISVPKHSRESFILIQFNTLSLCSEIVGVHSSQWCNSLNWIYLNDEDVFLRFPILIRILELISVLNHSRDSFILIKFNTFSLWTEIVSLHSSQWCNSLNWIYLNDEDVFLRFPILIRILELISVLNHSRDSFILIIFNTLSSWREIVSVLSSQWCSSLKWIYLNDADVFTQFPMLIRILELISVPKHSRDSLILIQFNTLSLWSEIVSVLSSQWCNSLKWIYLNDADVFLQFSILIRILELISVLNHSRDSFISIQFNTLSLWSEIISVLSSQLCNSLTLVYLNDADVIPQFPMLIRILELISVPKHSRDSLILIQFNTLSLWSEIVSVLLSQWCNSLKWIYLNDADVFPQFPMLIRILELISVPKHSRESFILMQFNTLSLWSEIVSVHSSQWCNSLNWIYLNDEDVFLQFPILIRILELISVLNHSRDSFILIIFNTLSSWREIVSVLSSQWCSSLKWIYLNDSDVFPQFPMLIRILELISVQKHSRESFILIQFNTLSLWSEIVGVHSSQWCNSLNWIYLNDEDVFLQFPIMIRILELISVLNHSRDSFILIIFNPLSSCREIVSVLSSQWCSSLKWIYLNDADVFPQFPMLIRILELISVPKHSRESFILMQFNTLSLWSEIVGVHSSQWCNSLNWIYLNDEDVFLQFPIMIRILELISVLNHSRDSFILIIFNPLSSCREIVSVLSSQWCSSLKWIYLNDSDVFPQFPMLIRILELISVPKHSRESFILIQFNTLSLWSEIVGVHSSQWCNSLNWIYLNDEDVFLRFPILIRILELISVLNHSRDSFILIIFNTLSSWREIVSVLSSQWCSSLKWIYLNDADVFTQFPMLIRILELISVPKHSRDSLILIQFNTLSLWSEIVSVLSSQWCNSLKWIYLNDADVFLQFSILIRILELISVLNHSRDSFISIQFNTLSLWSEIISVLSSQLCNSLTLVYLNDADVIPQFPMLIRILELISVPKHSRDSLILIQFNTLSLWSEIVSVLLSQWCNSLKWIYLNDADVFPQFPMLIRILELISVPKHSRESFILMQFNTLSLWSEIVSVHSSQWCNSLNWIYLNDEDVFLQFPILIRILELISVLNHSRDSFILIIFNTLSSWREIVSVLSSQWCSSLKWIYLNDSDVFPQFPMLIRILELISVQKHSRESFILIQFNTLSLWSEIVGVHSSQWCNSLNWIYLNDEDVFLQFPIMIRILELISVLNHSRDSFILIIFNPLSSCREIVSVLSSQWCSSLKWIYLNDADVFPQFPMLIRILELISVPKHSRESFILMQFNTLSLWSEIVGVHSSQWCNSLNWIYLNDEDVFLQFPIMIRILELISVLNHSRDSFILIIFNPLSSCREIVSVLSSQWCSSLKWIYLNDSDVFPQFPMLIRILELISVPKHSRESFILIQFNTLSLWSEIVGVHSSQWCNSLNWIYLNDEDVFLQFPIMIRILELISVLNHSRDSFILIIFNPLSSCREIVSVLSSQWCSSLKWIYLNDADVFPQFPMLIRILELISVPKHSRESFILMQFNTLSLWSEIVGVHSSQWCNSLNWIYLNDEDVFLQFPIMIRILELISVLNHSRDSFILIIFNPLSSCREIVSVLSSQWCSSLKWIYLNDADVFPQFPMLIRILELISVLNHSRDSFISIQFNTLSLWSEIVSVLSSQWCSSLKWIYLNDADVFPQFPMLIRILELISVPKHSRESFILMQFNTLSLWSEIVGVHSSQWCNSLNWIYLNDEDVFLQFPIMIRILELISVLNHSRDSFIFIIFNPLSSCREIVSVLSSQWCSSLKWIYLNDADVFPQFPMLIRILELISVPKHSRDSLILIQFNTLSLWSEIVSVLSSQWCNSLKWIYLNDADVFLQFSILIRILELISVLNHSRDSFISIQFNTLSLWSEIVSVLSSQWCSSLKWIYLNDADVFPQFPMLIRILELISVPKHSRDSLILIQFNTLSLWSEIVSVLSSQWCNSLKWIYLNDADVFLQFSILIRILELISILNHSRDSFISIQFNTLSLWSEIISALSSQLCNSLNWVYLNDADVFLQFSILIRILELISVLNHSRDSFISIQFNTLSLWSEIVSVLSSQLCNSLNWVYLNDADVFLQFSILIRILELISVLNHSRDSFISIQFNTLSLWSEIISVLSSQLCNSLNWVYLNDADVFPQFPMLIRILELISVPKHSRESFILIQFNTLSLWSEIVSVLSSQWCNSLKWIYLNDADVFLQFSILIRILELISVLNHSRDSFISIQFNTLSLWSEIISVLSSQLCNSLNWVYLNDADVFPQFPMLIRILELISVPKHSRESFILIQFNTLSLWSEIVSVLSSQWCNSLKWIYLNDADVFLQFSILIRILELISVLNHSRDSFISIQFNTLSLWSEIISVLSSQLCNSLNWVYLNDADVFPQFPMLIRILELIFVPKHSRESFILIQFNTLSLWSEIVGVHSSQWCNSLNWIYLNDEDVFLQFPIMIRILELISVLNHSRDSFILIIFNPLSSCREIVSVLSSQWCSSLKWIYLNDADVFPQFPMLIRILELISVPKHSRESFILIQFNTLSLWSEIVGVHSSQWCNSLNWIYLNDEDVFLQFPILIRILELISVLNHSRDSFILIIFNTLSSWREIVSVLSSQWCSSLKWIYLNDADVFPQFPMFIRILELISVPKHSRDSLILIQFNTLSLWSEIVSVLSSQWCNSLKWIYLNDADVFLQFSILIRILELISVLNHSRDSFISIQFNTLSLWSEIISVLSSQLCNSPNWVYLNDADVFPQFPMLIRILELISVPKHSRESFILIQFNTLSLWSEIVSVLSSQWCNSLKWIYLNDADVFLQFSILIRILELISVLNHSRDSFISIQFNTLSLWSEIVSVFSSQWCSSLKWIYLNDADVFPQFPMLIRILELISVLNHSRDSCILIIFNTLSSWREIVSVLSSQWFSSLKWIYLNDVDVFPQFPMLIRILELISVPKHSRDSLILIQFNTLSLWSEIVSVLSSQWCNSLRWIYLNDADVFLQFSILIRILELISVLNHSRDSFISIQFNTLSLWSEIISVLSSQLCNSLNWVYLNDADVFPQFPMLIRILELISVPKHSRDSLILIQFNTLSLWSEIVSVLSSQWCNSLKCIYLNDADVFLQFSIQIRILELISVLNHSRDSFILILYNSLSSWREIVSILSSFRCNSLKWIYLNDADVFLQFSILIRILELISVLNHSRDSFISIQFNTLSLQSETISVLSSQLCNSLNWMYLNHADCFLQFPM